MTTIAVRAGVMASDSRVTHSDEHDSASSALISRAVKLFRRRDAIIGLAGESSPGLIFLDWYGSGKPPPSVLIDGEADFTALVLTRRGIFTYDAYCRGERIIGPFWAIGSGAKGAMCAMHAGASAERAVEICCMVDPYTAPPVHVLKLKR